MQLCELPKVAIEIYPNGTIHINAYTNLMIHNIIYMEYLHRKAA